LQPKTKFMPLLERKYALQVIGAVFFDKAVGPDYVIYVHGL
jgi:hypothetical protein